MTSIPEPKLPVEARELLLRQRARLQELQARVDELDRAGNEPIAIVGMGCRFPGGASSPGAFWQILRDGEQVIAPGTFDVLTAKVVVALGYNGVYLGGGSTSASLGTIEARRGIAERGLELKVE